MKCSVQVALLPHRLTWSAFLGPPVLLLMLLFVPKGPSIARESGHVFAFVPKGPGD